MILGLDVSTSITGFCALDDRGRFVSAWYADCRKTKDFFDKMEIVDGEFDKKFFVTGDNRYNVGYVFIEDKLSGFAGGRTSQQTMMKLASFNGAVTYAAHQQYGSYPIHIHPSTIKALLKKDGLIIPKGYDKKKATLDFVRERVEGFPYEETRNGNPQAYCYDMADAYITARAGFLKFVKPGLEAKGPS